MNIDIGGSTGMGKGISLQGIHSRCSSKQALHQFSIFIPHQIMMLITFIINMIKKIITSSLLSKYIKVQPSIITNHRPFSFPVTRLAANFSSDKNPLPKNKQEAWMMQEQKNLKADMSNEDDSEGKTYEGVTKIGIAGFLILSGSLFYMLYFASEKSSQNLDTVDEEISGLKELKQRQSLIGGDWTLTGTEGQGFSSRNLQGYYYLIYFGYTSCPDICPSSLYYLSSVYRIIRNLPEGAYMKLKVVFVSVDPERDTPKVMKDYLAEFGKNIVGVTGVTGDNIELQQCLKKFKIKSKKIYYTQGPKKGSYEIDHTTRVYLMDPDNVYLDHLDPSLTEQQTAKAIVAKIVQNQHMKQKAEQKIGS